MALADQTNPRSCSKPRRRIGRRSASTTLLLVRVHPSIAGACQHAFGLQPRLPSLHLARLIPRLSATSLTVRPCSTTIFTASHLSSRGTSLETYSWTPSSGTLQLQSGCPPNPGKTNHLLPHCSQFVTRERVLSEAAFATSAAVLRYPLGRVPRRAVRGAILGTLQELDYPHQRWRPLDCARCGSRFVRTTPRSRWPHTHEG